MCPSGLEIVFGRALENLSWILSGYRELKSRFINGKCNSAGLLVDLEYRKRADGLYIAVFALIINSDINFERALS
jgi:hypothetical protein